MAQTLFFPSHKSYREEERIYIEFLGGSFSGYAYHMTAVHPDSIYFNHQSLSMQDVRKDVHQYCIDMLSKMY